MIEFAPRSRPNSPASEPILGYSLVNPELILHATIQNEIRTGFAISHRSSGLRASPILDTLSKGFEWASLVAAAPWADISADGTTIPDEVKSVRRAADSAMGL
jgi:hypothetical protein